MDIDPAPQFGLRLTQQAPERQGAGLLKGGAAYIMQITGSH